MPDIEDLKAAQKEINEKASAFKDKVDAKVDGIKEDLEPELDKVKEKVEEQGDRVKAEAERAAEKTGIPRNVILAVAVLIVFVALATGWKFITGGDGDTNPQPPAVEQVVEPVVHEEADADAAPTVDKDASEPDSDADVLKESLDNQ